MRCSSGGGTASWPPELVVVLLLLWLRKVITIQVGGAWHQRWWFRRSLAWAEAQTATENHWVVDFDGRRSSDEKSGLGYERGSESLL